jgi:phosphoribosyl 1,2-cyclic phosphate phosphodiesterase
MEIVFLGTAAAEGLPAPYCSCDVCSRARKAGGKDLRLRSSVLIDGVLQIDNGPDTAAQAQRLALCLDGLRSILFTHTHEDHLYADGALMFVRPFTMTMKGRLVLYGPGGVSESFARSAIFDWVKDAVEFKPLNPFVRVSTGDGYVITPLLANHVPEKVCMNYVVAGPDGKTLLYALDTGPWPEATWEYLASERPALDAAVMEATAGTAELGGSPVHLNFKMLLENRAKMINLGVISRRAPFLATHFSHNGCGLQSDMAKALKGSGVKPAYDGLRVKI